MTENTGVTGDWMQDTTLLDALKQGANASWTYIHDNPALIFFAVAATAFMVLWLMQLKRKPKPQGEQDEMKRRVQLESTYADRIHDFMLDMLFKGEITRKEYKRDCKRFGIAFRLMDLLRPPHPKLGIKHRVRHNVAVNHSTLQYIQPGPGPKPGKTPPALPVKPSRKVWLVVGKRRIAT